jgi:Tfp pilus assembly protein PilO
VKLVQRIFLEKRSILVPLAFALVINLGVYAFVVRPLEKRSANAADRARTAGQSLQAANAALASASALVKGKSLADQELATFYKEVLPSDLSAARRLTYVVPALAHKARVKYQAKQMEQEEVKEQPGKEARLARLKTRVILQGDYEAVRQFVYDLETSSEFVIIDDVSLVQADADKPLTLTLELSTYYRLRVDGT